MTEKPAAAAASPETPVYMPELTRYQLWEAPDPDALVMGEIADESRFASRGTFPSVNHESGRPLFWHQQNSVPALAQRFPPLSRIHVPGTGCGAAM